MYAQKLSFDYAHTLHTVRIVHNAHSVHRSRVQKGQSCDCINFVRATDPCSGSGHILAYLFDVLMQIYESYGYTTREAVASIVENNLYGLDIDDRAAQLAYFAVMMKARQYDRRFFSRDIQPHVYAIAESNHVDSFALEYFCDDDAKLKKAMETIISELYDAKEYGSILPVTPQDWTALYDRFTEIEEDIHISREAALRELLPLVQVAEALAQKYDVVVTNPPYMGASGMSAKLSDYVKKNYPDSKSDLFAVFIERCGQMAKKNGYQAMITQHAWMFLSSFEKLRGKLLHTDIVNMAHLGARAFEEIGGEVVQTTSFVIRKSHIADYKGEYCRLIEPTSQQGKEDMFLAGENWYAADQSNFSKIPGSPVAYWVSEKTIAAFQRGILADIADTKQGFATGDNNRFLKFWQEIDWSTVGLGFESRESARESSRKWFPTNKGGSYRKWYGNNIYVANWENDGSEMRAFSGSVIRNPQYYFRQGITWSSLAGGRLSMRYSPKGFIFESKGSMCYLKDDSYLFYVLATMNTKVVDSMLGILAPTLDYHEGPMSKVPVVIEYSQKYRIECKAKECVNICQIDWDSFETSWDFQCHPLIQNCHGVDNEKGEEQAYIEDAYTEWEFDCNRRFNQLKANEEELNRIFIDIYGLQDELTPKVEDKDVTVRKADLSREIRSFISYAVGCMFGRYSPYKEGLFYAGGEWDYNAYEDAAWVAKGKPEVLEFYKQTHFMPDEDNIIPICDDEYFADDIVGRFVEFVEEVYGADTLDENLKFIADALGGNGQPKDVIRNYFMNDFYKDHCKIYQKRPIYWLFDSGKKNGFKALIYMHRYQPDTIARIRTDYVHEQQARYRTAIADLEQRIANASTGERVKLNKRLKALNEQAAEIHAYEEKIHHLADQMISIDLDDGVKKNYAIFQDVLAKIK